MRIKNKYIRNRLSRVKHWKSVRNRNHPFVTLCPYRIDVAPSAYWVRNWDTEEQIKSHFEWIDEQARAIESGHHRSFFHAPKHYRQRLWKLRKAQEKVVMAKIRQGDYDAEMPTFKQDADWLWF